MMLKLTLGSLLAAVAQLLKDLDAVVAKAKAAADPEPDPEPPTGPRDPLPSGRSDLFGRRQGGRTGQATCSNREL